MISILERLKKQLLEQNRPKEQVEQLAINILRKNGILKNPKDYKKGSSLTTIWFDSLTDKEKKEYWDKVGNEWGKRFLPQNYIQNNLLFFPNLCL